MDRATHRRGKAGKFNILGIALVEKSSDLKEIKQKWRTFKENYERKVCQEIRDNKDAEMFCKNCKRFIPAGRYLNHMIKYNYCKNVDRHVKFENFKADFMTK